jgi:Tfp pilus assembly protein PilV
MTLVELMVSLVIFGVIIAVVFGFLTESRRSYQSTRQKAQYQQGLRAVMSLVTRDVRSAGCDPAGAGFERFPAGGVQAFRCRMDLNGDGDVTDTGPDEDVAYTFDANTGELSRAVAGGAAVVIMRGLQNCTFNYYDNQGAVLGNVPLNATDRARIMAVDLVIAGETERQDPVHYSTRVAVRNN